MFVSSYAEPFNVRCKSSTAWQSIFTPFWNSYVAGLPYLHWLSVSPVEYYSGSGNGFPYAVWATFSLFINFSKGRKRERNRAIRARNSITRSTVTNLLIQHFFGAYRACHYEWQPNRSCSLLFLQYVQLIKKVNWNPCHFYMLGLREFKLCWY